MEGAFFFLCAACSIFEGSHIYKKESIANIVGQTGKRKRKRKREKLLLFYIEEYEPSAQKNCLLC